jgi:hypothetical protein
MKANEIDKARNPLLKLALPALQRAAQKAREQAILHNTRLILWRENQVVRLSADEIREQAADYKAD